MSKPTLNNVAVVSFFAVFVICLSFALEVQALPYADAGQSYCFELAPSALAASVSMPADAPWNGISLVSSGVSNVLASEVSSPLGSASVLSEALQAETVIIAVIGLLALVLVLRALGLRYYVEKNDRRDKAVEEKKAEERRSIQSPKVMRPVESFTKRLELAMGSQIPSDIALPSVFRAENSDLCGFNRADVDGDVAEPALVDIETSISDDVNDSIDSALCDMHALIYNINVAIEKIHSNPLSSSQAKSILVQSQMHARAIQYSLREIQSDLKTDAISKQRSA